MNIRNFLASQGYRDIKLVLQSNGHYSSRDSEWNYSDVPHLNYIHTKVEACTLLITKKAISNIFLQKIGPFLLPATVHISHVEPSRHEYVMTILNIVISIQTKHAETEEGCKTTTKYQFFYKGFAGWLVALLAKYATKGNYQTLMSEDMPMRLQRGKLRDQGFKFELDHLNLIGFTDTLDIKANHLNGKLTLDGAKEILIELTGLSGHIDIDQYKCSVHWSEQKIWILPMVCPHEGAELCFQAIKDSPTSSEPTTSCPWHGRRLNPLVTLNRESSDCKLFYYLHTSLVARAIKCMDKHSSNTQLFLSAKRPKT